MARRGETSPEKKRSECVHHWMIKTPNGPTARARCKRCGAKREFDTGYNPRWNSGARALRSRNE